MIKINVYDPNQENDSNTDPDEIIHVFYPLKKAKLWEIWYYAWKQYTNLNTIYKVP